MSEDFKDLQDRIIETQPVQENSPTDISRIVEKTRNDYGLDTLLAPKSSTKPNHLRDSIDIAHKPKNPNYKRRRDIALGFLAAGAAGGVLGGGIQALGNLIDNPTPTNQESIIPITDTYNGTLNERVASIDLQNEARLRGQAVVADEESGTNLIQEVHLPDGSSITIDTPEGVYIANDESNGSWYGIRVQDLPPELAQTAKMDKDGVVWVNTQKADPTYTNIEPQN